MNDNRIFPLLYAGPLSYYAQYIPNPGFLDKHEPFAKQSYRNRMRVYGANGVIVLSIPITGESSKNTMGNVQISNIEPWQRNHWKTLESAYKSSPFFEFYNYLIAPLYQETYYSLWEFNQDFHQVILECLAISIPQKLTSEFTPITALDIRAIYSSKKPHPLSHSFPKYQQVFSYQKQFEPDLSILDLLFNLGPETESYLLQLPI